MSEVRIQAALDYNLNLDDAYRIIDATKDYVEVFEIGTPFLLANGGVTAIKEVRKRYPDICIYADLKLRDDENGAKCGIQGTIDEVVKQAAEAGANIVTVMAYSGDETMKKAIEAARKYNVEILIDLMDIEDVTGETLRYDQWKPDYISVNRLYVNHPENDDGIYHPLLDLEAITPLLKNAKASIQGGVSFDNIAAIAKLRPSLICIGRGIYAAADPRENARKFKEIIDQNS